MNSKRFPLLGWLLASLILIVAFMAIPAHAQTALTVPTPTVATPAPAPAPHASILSTILDPQFIEGIVAIVASVLAFWKHSQLTGYKKALGAVVVGVENATSLPQVQHLEDTVKSTIQAEASKFGVENLLHDTVQALTPFAKQQIAALTNAPAAPAPAPAT